MFELPYEIQEQIMCFTSLEDCIVIGYPRIAQKIYNEYFHTIDWCITNNNTVVLEWLLETKIKKLLKMI